MNVAFIVVVSGFAPSLSSASPQPLFSGRCGIAVTDAEAQKIASHGWLDAYNGSIGFWYNWDDHSSISMRSAQVSVPFLPTWWGSQVWEEHPAQQGWCDTTQFTPIATESGPRSVAFAWNEPAGGYKCKYSMGACPGGDYSGERGAKLAAESYSGCVEGAQSANRLVSTPCLNNLDPDWFTAFRNNRPPQDVQNQPETVCCSHIYASQYNGAPWDSCDLNAMTNLDKLPGQLQSLVDNGVCDYHFIQEIGIGGCPTADSTVSALLMKNLGDAVRNIPSVYLGWFANSQGDGGTARKTTWLFEEHEATLGNAYKTMCASLETPSPSPSPPPAPLPPSRGNLRSR
jgi:hypothetical protein